MRYSVFIIINRKASLVTNNTSQLQQKPFFKGKKQKEGQIVRPGPYEFCYAYLYFRNASVCQRSSSLFQFHLKFGSN
jgi:hypothetical protein